MILRPEVTNGFLFDLDKSSFANSYSENLIHSVLTIPLLQRVIDVVLRSIARAFELSRIIFSKAVYITGKKGVVAFMRI